MVAAPMHRDATETDHQEMGTVTMAALALAIFPLANLRKRKNRANAGDNKYTRNSRVYCF